MNEMTSAEVGQGHTCRVGCAATASIVPVSGRSGRGRQEEMAAFFITEQWRFGPNPNFLRFSGLVQAAQLGSVLASPPRRLGSDQLTEFYASSDAPAKGE